MLIEVSFLLALCEFGDGNDPQRVMDAINAYFRLVRLQKGDRNVVEATMIKTWARLKLAQLEFKRKTDEIQ